MHVIADSPSPTGGELLDFAALQSTEGTELLARWRAFAARARHANPFQGPEMLVPAMRHLAREDQVRLLMVPEPGRESDVGLVMPLAMRKRIRRIPWRATASWQHTHHFLGTPLVSDTFGVEGWCAALAHLEQHSPDPWLFLACVDADVVADLEVAASQAGREVRRLEVWTRPVTYRRPTDDYMEQRLSGSRRKELRRVWRRLSEAAGGDLRLVDVVGDGLPLEEGVDAFLRLEGAGWKGAGGAMGSDPHESAFFREVCSALADRDGVEILALQGRDDCRVAMAVNLRDSDALFTFKIAYDERYASYSPGLLLSMEQLSRFHASGDRLLDTCAEPANPMANRLHADRRELVTLAVGLRGAKGNAMVRAAPSLLRTGDRARMLAHSVSRPAPAGSGRRRRPSDPRPARSTVSEAQHRADIQGRDSGPKLSGPKSQGPEPSGEES